ncbi:MAG: DUF5107 domain-containing protein [Phycisphaeraceae bacterium]
MTTTQALASGVDSILRVETLTIPAARLGPAGPLVSLVGATTPLEADASMSEDDLRHFGYGQVDGILPYWMQNDYDRIRRPRVFRALVLENATLRAVFLPELGGRLWSLTHKPSDRELLYTNPVFQPANLAIRDAWFSGGVEWNFGWRGHTPFTCSPVFAAQTEHDGTPVLRFYEWERQRQMAYQIDAWLPPDLPVLYVRVRLRNPHEYEVPVYWWSNIAVPQTPGGRVLAPADKAFGHSYDARMQVADFPLANGKDRSYPARNDKASDFFYKIDRDRRPWVAAVDEAGSGLFQTSTSRLRGRKMFVWGTAPGGENWQNFLTEPGHPYLEIQAGLAPTQSHCLPMPGGAEWTWLEAYGSVSEPPERVHDTWRGACRHVDAVVNAVVPEPKLELDLRTSATMASSAPRTILYNGSGWGALERRRRARAGLPLADDPALPFPDDSLTHKQQPWLTLLETGSLPAGDPARPPASWMTQAEWQPLIERSLSEADGGHWSAHLHLGVMHACRSRHDDARRALQRSLNDAPSAWAHWFLAQIAATHERWDEAAEAYHAAHELAPTLTRPILECGRAWNRAGQPLRAIEALDDLPPSLRRAGEAAVVEGAAALLLGDVERVMSILTKPITIANLREGDTSLTSLWFRLHARKLTSADQSMDMETLKRRLIEEHPPPVAIDFRSSWHDVRF